MAGELNVTQPGLYSPQFHFDNERHSLHDLASWTNGLAFKNISFSPIGIPVVKIAEVKGGIGPDTKRTLGQYDDSIRLHDGDLLFCWSGQPDTSIGTFRWWGGPAWLNQHIFKVTPGPDITFDYLHALLRYLQPNFVQIARNKQTTGLGHVTKADLRHLTVQVPSTTDQDRITGLIGPLDERIELNRRMAETLEGMARTLFQSWFVDFDPVRAKAENRPTGLPDDLSTLFPNRFGEDGSPEEWELGSVGKFVDVNPRTPLPAGTVAPYIDMAALPTRAVRIRSFIERPAGSGSRFQNGDTLVARITPCLENGKTAIVDLLEDGKVAWGSTEFIVLRPRAGVPSTWPYLLARQEPFRSHLIASMSGTSGRQRVPPSAVERWEVAQPSALVLEAFGDVTSPMFERIKALDTESDTLAALRDSLLPRLISGELRIAEAERAVAAA